MSDLKCGDWENHWFMLFMMDGKSLMYSLYRAKPSPWKNILYISEKVKMTVFKLCPNHKKLSLTEFSGCNDDLINSILQPECILQEKFPLEHIRYSYLVLHEKYYPQTSCFSSILTKMSPNMPVIFHFIRRSSILWSCRQCCSYIRGM